MLDEAEARACARSRAPHRAGAKRRADCRLSDALAPGLAELGVFLPYSPLHHLLLRDFGGPLVATSGNISGEPVLTDNGEAERRLAKIADAFLHHDRPIVRPADDSVVRVIAGRPRPIRIGRGIAPLEFALPCRFAEPTLAVGGHMKGAIALGWDKRVVVSPHIGELDSPRSLAVFEQVIADLQALYRVEARAHRLRRPSRLCQHALGAGAGPAARRACSITWRMPRRWPASIPEIARWLIFTWDGVGLGDDGELVGRRSASSARRAPGAASPACGPSISPAAIAAGREPWRSAAALMWETGHDWQPDIEGAALARQAWDKRIGTRANLVRRPPVRCRRRAGARHRDGQLRRAGADDARSHRRR